MKTGGSIGKLTIEGIPFNVMGDANFNEVFTEYENELIPTSGEPMLVQKKRIAQVENVILGTNAADRESLRSFNDSLDELKMSYTNAEGATAKAQGKINIDGNETENNRTTLTLLPKKPWVVFLP